MDLKDLLNLDLETVVKPWLRLETAADDVILQLLIDGSANDVESEICRYDLTADSDELPGIAIQTLNLIAYRYENRGDAATIPEHIKNDLDKYRFNPGL